MSGFRLEHLEHRQLRDGSNVRYHQTACQNLRLLHPSNTATGGGMRRIREPPLSSGSIVIGLCVPSVHRCRFRVHEYQQAWSSGYDFCLTTHVFGYTEGSEFDSQGL
jgi:hypothetical protein